MDLHITSLLAWDRENGAIVSQVSFGDGECLAPWHMSKSHPTGTFTFILTYRHSVQQSPAIHCWRVTHHSAACHSYSLCNTEPPPRAMTRLGRHFHRRSSGWLSGSPFFLHMLSKSVRKWYTLYFWSFIWSWKLKWWQNNFKWHEIVWNFKLKA